MRRAWLLGVVAGAWLASVPARALPPERDDWIRIRTEHFTVYSNAGENAALRIAKNLAAFRAVLPRVTRSLRLESAAPVSVYVFSGRTSFAPYKRDEDLALSVSHLDGTYLAMSAFPSSGKPGRLRRSYLRYPLKDLYHEYTHFVVRNNFADPPLWINEGLAELYSTYSVFRKHAEIGRALPEYLALLRVAPWYSLRDLVGARVTPADRRARAIFFAQSWALVHYLAWNGPEAKARLDRSLALADAGYAPLEAFDAVFGADAPALERQVRGWVLRHSFRFLEVDLSDVATPALTAVPMARAEVLVRLGDLLLHTRPERATEAEEHFRESLRLDAGAGAAWRGLGRALQAQGRHVDSRAAFTRAIELDPADGHARSLLAANLLGEIGRGADEPRTAELLHQARELYRSSLDVDPSSGEALAGFGATWVLDADPSEQGVAALERARILLPAQMDVSCALMALLLRTGQRPRAVEIATGTLRESADPLVRQLAVSAEALASPTGAGAERRRALLRDLLTLVEGTIPDAIPEAGRRDRIAARLRAIRLLVSAAAPPADEAAPRSFPPGGTP